MTSKYGTLTPIEFYKKFPERIPEHVHGTAGGYSNYGCRCETCTTAHSKALYRAKERRMQRPTPAHVHGSANGYGNYGCRCEPCTKAWTDDSRDRSQRRRARNRAKKA